MKSKEQIIENILEKYKEMGKVCFLVNDMTYHADSFEDLNLMDLCDDVAKVIEIEARRQAFEEFRDRYSEEWDRIRIDERKQALEDVKKLIDELFKFRGRFYDCDELRLKINKLEKEK